MAFKNLKDENADKISIVPNVTKGEQKLVSFVLEQTKHKRKRK